MKKALILAAGFGSRLLPLTETMPKSLVEVNGEPIVFKQLRNLQEAGITEITLVAGYLADVMIQSVTSEFEGIQIVVNDDYATTNNMYSALLGMDSMGSFPDGLLLMNADVFHDATVERALLDYPAPDAIVVDIGCYMEESMKVVLGDDGCVKHISKTVSPEEAFGCSIDVYKFSEAGANAFLTACRNHIDCGELNLWSEVALDEVLGQIRFEACPLCGRWVEIDNHEDLAEVEKLFSERLAQ